MSAGELYEASLIKRSHATNAEMKVRGDTLFKIVRAMRPMTVRQVFYQASVHGLVDKTEAGYGKVQRMLLRLRRQKILPYNWITDGTRWIRKPDTHGDPGAAAMEVARFYRKAVWDDLDHHVEIWIEKAALAGVLYPVTSLYDVPLMVAGGYSSETFLYETAEYIKELAARGVRTWVYHFGDYDPSGVNAAEKIRDGLNRMAPAADIQFERAAVTPKQIKLFKLPTRPTKKSDSRSKNFGSISVELDSIEPDTLRRMVTTLLENHLPVGHLSALRAAEQSERMLLTTWARSYSTDADRDAP